MTKYEFFEAVANTADLSEEIHSYAVETLTKLDKEAEERVSKNRAKWQEDCGLVEEIVEILRTGDKLASELADALTTEERRITTSKVIAVANKMEEVGMVEKSDTKIAKVGTRKIFTLVSDDMEKYRSRC